MRSSPRVFLLPEMFAPSDGDGLAQVMHTEFFERTTWSAQGQARLILDRFLDGSGAACCFLSLAAGEAGIARFVLPSPYGLQSCPSGGWLLQTADRSLPAYWIPQSPVARRFDPKGRILSEEPASLTAFNPAAGQWAIDIAVRADANLECAVWRLPPEASGLVDALEQPLVLEMQPIFMWSSHTAMCGPADVYRYLVHGQVYENRFDWRRKRKICSELEAYSLYVALCGLEAATGKKIYGLLMRQILFSVIARQAADGGWHHGEWTDFMESHYRFHNAAMLLLESALEAMPGGSADHDLTRRALDRAAAVLSRCTDKPAIGLWFLHDSLELSVEETEQSGMRWVPSRVLGKSLTNKMILNTHLDAIVALDRYREVTGDEQYSAQVVSALSATQRLLALRPAEPLYRALYWAVGLTLLPSTEARQLPLILRVVRRLTRSFLIPQLHRVKRPFPRIVMPGGLIERHLSRLHFGTNYHSVNAHDLARVWRRFPAADFEAILDGAVGAVTKTSLAAHWGESKQDQPLGFWVEALYQLCTLKSEPVYRRYLAEAMLSALDAGLGLPPSLLGAHPEVVKPARRLPCPSPADPHLRVANLSRGDCPEMLVVNPTPEPIELAWEGNRGGEIVWVSADGRPFSPADAPLSVPSRGWLWGRGGQAAKG